MHLSRKSDYALRAMTELAAAHPAGPWLSAKQIAAMDGVPRQFLEQILHTLKQAGLVRSALGARGGYALAKPPQDITLGRVIRLFEGSVAPTGCVDQDHPAPCAEARRCRFHQAMRRLRDAVASVVDHTTLADVAGERRG